jgi:hypothetical protein
VGLQLFDGGDGIHDDLSVTLCDVTTAVESIPHLQDIRAKESHAERNFLYCGVNQAIITLLNL